MLQHITFPFRNESVVADPVPNKLRRIVTSAVLLLAANIITQLAIQIYIYIFTTALGYDTTFGYHWVVAKPFAWDMWGSVRVVAIYGMPPIFCLIGAYIVQFVFINYSATATRKKLFYIWLQTCMVNTFLVQVFILPAGTKGGLTGFYQTFSIVATWFRAEGYYFIPLSFAAAIAAIGWGIFIAPQLHTYSFSSRLIQTREGKDAITRQVFLFPVMIAAPFIALFSNQYSFFVHVLFVAFLALMYIGVIIRHRTDHSVVLCTKEDFLNRISWIEIAITAVIWITVILLFNK
ncbi:MAG: hypothetical protein NZM35_00755 [Chitinophagales bacterium]|nr:hypothetical protein [Chitinophagales bacterium]MDW8418769.1 hypothetical protein [Chitinophagales bacterium]